ncbi:MAG: serine hydroxymethyltransferase [Candidatus Bathyarchaeota archaeon]|nr:MAG: serine hydroxymethyltransferase [Candidatus Bathyarchaeota archaeon]
MMKKPREFYDKVFELLKTHQLWFQRTIPLVASENVPSPAVREALISDFGNRYAEGWPGERVYAGCKYIDQVELLCIDLTKKLFNAEFADVRPVSGVTANLAMYTAFTEPNDRMLALSIPCGGHISMGKKRFSGTAGSVHGLRVEYFPYDYDELNIDVDATKKLVKDMKGENDPPRLAMFGSSVFPFPHPVKDLAETFHDVDAKINYDAAHVAGLIAGGKFQNPLREGADSVTLSTHKTLPGPQHGAILSWDRYADQIKKGVFPGISSNHHLHALAGFAVAMCEMLEFGEKYTEQIIRNARSLGQALFERGFKVLAEKKNFTESHVILVDITEFGHGGELEKELEKASIILNRNLLPWDIKQGRHYWNPGGIRIGTPEVTRLGMGKSEMEQIAEFIKRIVIDKESPEKVEEDVQSFRKEFQKVHYCFENSTQAYEYMKLR